jgi:DNA-binding CsgD family transcriptional regulator
LNGASSSGKSTLAKALRPSLSGRETEALRLYAAGMPMKVVARRMGVGVETAKQYIERVRLKHRRVGREAETKIDLYRRAYGGAVSATGCWSAAPSATVRGVRDGVGRTSSPR